MIVLGELMIGNWLIDTITRQPFKVTANWFYGTGYTPLPIPLSSEVLEKCGFEDNRIFKETITIEIDLDYDTEFGYAVFIEQWNHGETARIIIPGWIKYLHQLQNLYYALTQSELEVNL